MCIRDSVGHGLVHAIEAAHKRRFAAPGRTDDRRRVIGRRIHGDVIKRLRLAEPRIQLVDFDPNTHASVRSLEHSTTGHDAHRTHRQYDQHD